ncbi:leucine-rich repeat extensin-like protein 3 [Iris pallida]|uniref:Leucine-rich repeat extensin-like protein 3 n=1 Tax=Iris pallida TaxID=29817 RepID=A0AAX6GH28_IRIPA|nr:leucine-rich repeat extensin-like protein 3 [Iris pallida]
MGCSAGCRRGADFGSGQRLRKERGVSRKRVLESAGGSTLDVRQRWSSCRSGRLGQGLEILSIFCFSLVWFGLELYIIEAGYSNW